MRNLSQSEYVRQTIAFKKTEKEQFYRKHLADPILLEMTRHDIANCTHTFCACTIILELIVFVIASDSLESPSSREIFHLCAKPCCHVVCRENA